MKKSIIAAMALGSWMLLPSCNKDFDTNAPYKPVTVVYGLLNIGDTAQYIKIERAFQNGKDGDATVIAQKPDSLYYKNLDAKIEEITNGTVSKTYQLQEVDLNAEGYPKESGTFAGASNIAYKFKGQLDALKTYRLVIVNPQSGETITAQTPIITNDPAQFRFSQLFTSPNVAINMADPTKTISPAAIAPPNAKMFTFTMRFRYVEKNTATGEQTAKYIDWVMADRVKAGNTNGNTQVKPSSDVSNSNFYELLGNDIPAAGPNIERYVDSVEARYWAGGEVLSNYIEVLTAQGGITNDQIKPIYTNLSGKESIGLMSTRTMRTSRTTLSGGTINTLKTDPRTAPLKFVGTVY